MMMCREGNNGLWDEAWLGQGRTYSSSSRLHSTSSVRTHPASSAIRPPVQCTAHQTERGTQQGVWKCSTAAARCSGRHFKQFWRRCFNAGRHREGARHSHCRVLYLSNLHRHLSAFVLFLCEATSVFFSVWILLLSREWFCCELAFIAAVTWTTVD